MSDQGHVFVSSGVPLGDAVAQIADALGARTAPRLPEGQNPQAVYLSRPSSLDPAYTVTIEVTDNDYLGDDALYGSYELELAIQVTGPRRAEPELLRAETGHVFDQIVAGLGWPAVDVDVGGFAHTAWSRQLGRTDFPPRTSSGSLGRPLWASYAMRTTSG